LNSSDSGRPAANGRALTSQATQWLNQLVKCGILSGDSAQSFLQFHGERLAEFNSNEKVGRALITAGLLTEFQLQRILAGQTHGMVLGNYRVLDKLGGGSVGVVYVAEHMHLKRRVALKVLPTEPSFPQSVLDRFYGEMRVMAQLNHPHIVTAYDAGMLPPADRDGPTLHYLAMELLESDLENYLYDHGPLPIAQGCEWMRQAASGLLQAHDHHLIHRDLKPSNILRTEFNQIKLVDFGLARVFSSHRTEPRCLLGSVEFMAPEQSIDPTLARESADIYGLGATLFWLVTGHTPYPREENVAEALRRLQTQKPRRLRDFLPEVPRELDALVAQMLARSPDERPESARVVMEGLARCAAPMAAHWEMDSRADALPLMVGTNATKHASHVLILDDDAEFRRTARQCLEPAGCICYEAQEALSAMDVINEKPIDLVLLDLNLPNVHGYDVCRALREHPPRAYLKILVASAAGGPDELATAIGNGADDFVPKPVPPNQLAAKVQHALHLKEAQDGLDQLARHLMTVNKQLENSLVTRAGDVRRAEDALLFAMAKMAETCETGISNHLRRLQKFVVSLAERLREEPGWGEIVNRTFIENLERCIPLHDLGKIGLPDHLVLKTAALTEDERRIMEQHTVIGADLIDAISESYGQSLEFLTVARAIVRHHHERFDGRGYPDRLAGEDIPAAARVATLADVYDSLRRQRPHRQPLTHVQTVRLILHESPGLFDPAVQRAFAACQEHFQQIYDSISD
jgi:response regulator RpfG family c-di-GMP phosphodiesterase